MDIYWHELNAYGGEIKDIAAKDEAFRKDPSSVGNLTHFGIGLSNRALLIVVGLCALVESRLFELAEEEESRHQFKVDDLAGQGLKRLQKYLSRSKRIDFGKIRNWDRFTAVYEIRNTFVHSYGGLVETKLIPKAEAALKNLNIKDALFGRRIRLNSNHMLQIHGIFESLFEELRQV